MQRVTIYILSFIVFFVIFYYGIYYILFHTKTNGNEPLVKSVQQELIMIKDGVKKTIIEFDTSKKYNILFLGSSHCYRTIDPAIFAKHGMSTYNLGSSSQTPLNSYCLLKKYIYNTEKVILEVYPVASNLSGRESFITFVNSVNDYSLLVDMTFHLNDLRSVNLLTIKPLIAEYLFDKPEDPVNILNGYSETNDSVKTKIIYEHYVMDEKYFKKQLHYIEKIIELCNIHGKKLYLVYAPVPKELVIENEGIFISEIKKLTAENHFKFYNYGRNHSLNSRNHFFDDDHLNKAGVKIFNERVISDMMR